MDIVARACDAKRGSSKRCLTSIRHLGINVTNYLSPSDHARDIAAKAHKRASLRLSINVLAVSLQAVSDK